MKQENKIVGLYPLTKFYLAIVLVVLDIIMPGILSKLVVFVIINIIAALSGVWKSFIRKVRNSVGVLFVILLFIQTFFYPRGEVIFSFWIFNAKLEGILFALKLGITLMGVGGSLIWFFSVTQEKDFVLALEKSGMSAKASYVVLSTLQMVPVLKKKSQTIMNAQKARGVETEGNLLVRAKVFVPTIIPLVLSSIAGTEERALTLEARGFSSGIKVIRHGDKHDVLSEIELEKFGVMLPLTVYLANELKKHGVRMKDNIITSDEMADQLQKIGKKE